jgi:hypothetical protein
MGNEERVIKEIDEAVQRLPVSTAQREAVKRAAINCIEIETGHVQLQTNINQQFEQLLRELGTKLSAEDRDET